MDPVEDSLVIQHLDKFGTIAAHFVENFDAVFCRDGEMVVVLLSDVLHVFQQDGEESLLAIGDWDRLPCNLFLQLDVILLAKLHHGCIIMVLLIINNHELFELVG